MGISKQILTKYLQEREVRETTLGGLLRERKLRSLVPMLTHIVETYSTPINTDPLCSLSEFAKWQRQ